MRNLILGVSVLLFLSGCPAVKYVKAQRQLTKDARTMVTKAVDNQASCQEYCDILKAYIKARFGVPVK